MENKIKNLRKNLNEDDLLKQQSEFLKESKDPNFQPTYSKLYKSDAINEKNKLNQESLSSSSIDLNSIKKKHDEPLIENVFMPLNIIEHYSSSNHHLKIDNIDNNLNDLEMVKLDDKLLKNKPIKLTNGKKKSLFLQFMESKRQKNDTNNLIKLNDDNNLTEKSIKLIDGSGLFEDKELAKKEIESISKENDNLLNRLNKDDKDKLIEQFKINDLDDNLIKFIKSRSNKKKEKTVSFKPIEKDYVDLNQSIKTESIKTESIPYINEEDIKKYKWLNMDKIENEKLKWMKPLEENEEKKKLNQSIEGKDARFNFDGDLIIDKEEEEKDYHLGLHHHGEQELAAGYTINELISLIGSKFIPQRILSLNILSNIFKRMNRGYYDICFNRSLIVELIDKTEILIQLRTQLDNSNLTLQLVTIKCLHSLICNTIYDEYCLDRLFCSLELGIEIPKLNYNNHDNLNELKDDQLCKLDVIYALIRMNLLPRLRYLLDYYLLNNNDNNSDINSIAIDNLIDILIRISRHSNESCKQLMETPYLIECLIDNFIITTKFINWKVLKLIRILFTTDKNNLIRIKKEYPNLSIFLRNYLITNPLNDDNDDNKEIYSIIIEVLRIWRVLFILDNDNDNQDSNKQTTNTIEQFIELTTNLRNCLNIKILVNNYFDLHYVSNLIHCLAFIIRKSPELEHFFTPIIQNLTFQWFIEIINYNELPKLDGCLAISSALLYLNWSSTSKEQINQYILKPFLNHSNLFDKLIDQLIINSSILNFREYHNSVYRDSSALPSFGSIYFGGSKIKLNSLLNEDSKIFLIGPLISLTTKHNLIDHFEKFIYNNQIKYYLDQIIKQTNKSSNWSIFELIEFNPISQLILWERNLLNKNNYFNHSLSIISSIGDQQLKQSLIDYIFNIEEYKLNYDHQLENNNDNNKIRNQLIKSSICFFNQSKNVYLKYCSFEDRNWLFEPIIKLYKLQSNLNSNELLSENEKIDNLFNWLNYLILIYNFKSEYLWSIIEPKILFIYLSIVYLFKNSLFLNENLNNYLKYFLIDLTTNYTIKFNCYDEKIIDPFNSIGDFFKLLCLNYSEESYGDIVFSNYLLCFVNQSSDKIFRKKLFDEYNCSLNYFILNKDHLLINYEQLIDPIDTDLKLIESYLRVIMSKEITKERNPLIYQLICTHIYRSLFDHQFQQNRQQNLELSNKLINCIHLSTNQQLKKDLNLI